ncbi:MAG: hypothetical protein IJ697_04160 [Synergistaceae bacterium]|nr:hypothetical protein [Synergistaceae bacterium]
MTNFKNDKEQFERKAKFYTQNYRKMRARFYALAHKVSEIAERPSITREDRVALNEAILSASGMKTREYHHHAASN